MTSRWRHGRFGFVLATEEHSAADLVGLAGQAEQSGFGFLFVSDHFHPWNFHQGHSSNLWPLLGAISQVTQHSALVSAVTSPILRVHPTTLAQSAATLFHLSQGRFYLGLGTGEALNERVVGQGFPPFGERLARLQESMELVRSLQAGEEVTREGHYFTVERAQLFDPAPLLQIFLAASGLRAATLASKQADGLVCLGAREKLARRFGDDDRPRLAQLSVCWAEDYQEAAICAHRYFPEVALPGTTFCQLATPREFSQAAQTVRVEEVAACLPCGPDVSLYVQAIEECFGAGFDAVALHQIGPNQRGFFNFWERELRHQLKR